MKLLLRKFTFILLTLCLSGGRTNVRAVTVEDTQADLQELASEFSEWKRQTIASFKTLNEKTDAISMQTQENKSPPVGFIYIQYGGQAEPSNLWPNAVWEQVSSDYAGLFFRVEGGKSETFGQTQYDDIGSLDIKGQSFSDAVSTIFWALSIFNVKGKGSFTSGDKTTLHLSYPTGNSTIYTNRRDEVRPINQAVRIWKRVQ